MSQKRRRGAPAPADRPNDTGTPTDDVIVPPGSDDWRERLREQARESARRREIRQQVRAQLAVARSAGLRHRHASKLGRCRHG